MRREATKKKAEEKYDIEAKINFAVFPGLQGGPHNHTIAALATTLKQAATPEFYEYQKQVMANSAAFADALSERGFELVSGGTDNHLVLVNMKASRQIDGARCERVFELAGIVTNKNTVPGDKSALMPGGVRMGAPALTSRGLVEDDMRTIAGFIDRGVTIAQAIKADTGKLKDFKAACADGPEVHPDLVALRAEVTAFASTFPTVGYD